MQDEIKKLVEKYSNNFELGEAVRRLYWEQKTNIKNQINTMAKKTTTTEKNYWNTSHTGGDNQTINWDEAIRASNGETDELW